MGLAGRLGAIPTHQQLATSFKKSRRTTWARRARNRTTSPQCGILVRHLRLIYLTQALRHFLPAVKLCKHSRYTTSRRGCSYGGRRRAWRWRRWRRRRSTSICCGTCRCRLVLLNGYSLVTSSMTTQEENTSKRQTFGFQTRPVV